MNARTSMNAMSLLCITVLPVHETAGVDSQYMEMAGQAYSHSQRYPFYMGTGSDLLGLNTLTTRRLA